MLLCIGVVHNTRSDHPLQLILRPSGNALELSALGLYGHPNLDQLATARAGVAAVVVAVAVAVAGEVAVAV